MGRKDDSVGKRLSRLVLVISAVGIGIRLWSKGLMGPQKLFWFLLLAAVAAAIDSGWVKLILALFALGFFLLEYVNYDPRQFSAVAGSALGLLIGLFGLFVMFGGLRGWRGM
jgi:membrane-bound ClpP family serine protease